MKKLNQTIPFDDVTDPFQTFRHLRRLQSDVFYFESSEQFDQGPDLTIIGLGPFKKLEGPILAGLDQVMKKSEIGSEVPYSEGGYFGCVGYECASEAETHLRMFPYFSDFEKNGSFVFHAEHLIVFDHHKQKIHFIGKKAIFHQQSLQEKKIKVRAVKNLSEPNPERLKASLGPVEFSEKVRQLKELIHAGEIFQGVLSERFVYQPILADPVDIFEALREISPTPYSYFFTFEQTDFFGASPETLVRVNGKKMSTHPIAGTRPRGATQNEDAAQKQKLLASRKEAAEHLMLVDLARNDVGRVAQAGSVCVESFRSVQYFSNVMHLVSKVGATLSRDLNPIDAFKSCFPAGTLTGSPKLRAMEILSKMEPAARGFYGGAVLALDPLGQTLDSCIAIRSMHIKAGRALLQAGAGIVADSKAISEYEEIIHKLRPLRQSISLAERRRHGSFN